MDRKGARPGRDALVCDNYDVNRNSVYNSVQQYCAYEEEKKRDEANRKKKNPRMTHGRTRTVEPGAQAVKLRTCYIRVTTRVLLDDNTKTFYLLQVK